MAHDVFISYASSDKAIADAVCSQLESVHRVRCWIAPRDVMPGANWAASIIDALDQSKIMVLIFSSNANASLQIEREVERAVHKGVNIIPLRIENTIPTKTLEYFISAPHWLDALTTPLEQHIARLAVAVKALLARAEREAAPPPLPVAPAGVAPTPPAVTPAPAAPTPAPPAFTSASPGREASAALAGTVDDSAPSSSRKGLVVAALIACVVLIGGVLLSRRAPRESRPQAPSESAAAPSVPAEGAAPAAADRPLEPATAAPATEAAPMVARPAVPKAVPKTVTNLLVDFRNTVDEGAISIEVDGKKVWSEFLGRGMKESAASKSGGAAAKGAPQGAVSAALTLQPGDHQASVTLVDENGKVRDTKAMPLTVAKQAPPQTLQIRLSRFKKDLQLKLVDAQAAKPAGSPQ